MIRQQLITLLQIPLLHTTQLLAPPLLLTRVLLQLLHTQPHTVQIKQQLQRGVLIRILQQLIILVNQPLLYLILVPQHKNQPLLHILQTEIQLLLSILLQVQQLLIILVPQHKNQQPQHTRQANQLLLWFLQIGQLPLPTTQLKLQIRYSTQVQLP